MDKAAGLEAFVARYPSNIVKGNALEQAMEAYPDGRRSCRERQKLPGGRLLLMISQCARIGIAVLSYPCPGCLRPI